MRLVCILLLLPLASACSLVEGAEPPNQLIATHLETGEEHRWDLQRGSIDSLCRGNNVQGAYEDMVFFKDNGSTGLWQIGSSQVEFKHSTWLSYTPFYNQGLLQLVQNGSNMEVWTLEAWSEKLQTFAGPHHVVGPYVFAHGDNTTIYNPRTGDIIWQHAANVNVHGATTTHVLYGDVHPILVDLQSGNETVFADLVAYDTQLSGNWIALGGLKETKLLNIFTNETHMVDPGFLAYPWLITDNGIQSSNSPQNVPYIKQIPTVTWVAIGALVALAVVVGVRK